MTEADAIRVIKRSPAWGNAKDYVMIDLCPGKHTDVLYRYNVLYRCRKTGRQSTVPLGVNKRSGVIINCTVDED